jgi:hypothetical protein
MPRKSVPRQTVTLAEGWRAHREAFELALREGITPAEAKALIAARAARARWAETERRLTAMINGERPQAPAKAFPAPDQTDESRPQPWWHN